MNIPTAVPQNWLVARKDPHRADRRQRGCGRAEHHRSLFPLGPDQAEARCGRDRGPLVCGCDREGGVVTTPTYRIRRTLSSFRGATSREPRIIHPHGAEARSHSGFARWAPGMTTVRCQSSGAFQASVNRIERIPNRPAILETFLLRFTLTTTPSLLFASPLLRRAPSPSKIIQTTTSGDRPWACKKQKSNRFPSSPLNSITSRRCPASRAPTRSIRRRASRRAQSLPEPHQRPDLRRAPDREQDLARSRRLCAGAASRPS